MQANLPPRAGLRRRAITLRLMIKRIEMGPGMRLPDTRARLVLSLAQAIDIRRLAEAVLPLHVKVFPRLGEIHFLIPRNEFPSFEPAEIITLGELIGRFPRLG